MIRQVLLTSPGERADLPQFGCGIRQKDFAPLEPLAASAQIQVRQGLEQWLGNVIRIDDIKVTASDESGGASEPGRLCIAITYALLDTLTLETSTVTV
jgi:phage baseplate assembly protein W